MTVPIPSLNIAFLKRTANNTQSVFDDSVGAIQGMLERAGFPAHVSYNTIVPEAVNIVVGAGMPGTPSLAELRRFTRPNNTIIFNTEQLGSDSILITEEYLRLLADYVVWDYCQDNIETLRQRMGENVTCHEFPIVPPPNFASLPQPLPVPRRFQFDFAFYGAVDVPRRAAILQHLHQHGLRIKLIAGAFGQDLAMQLLDCKAVLNLHAYETGLFEIGRCLRPMALGLPILSETSRFPACVDWANSGIVFAPTEHLLPYAQALVNHVPMQQTACRRMQHFVADVRWPRLAKDILHSTLRQLQQR